MKKPFVILAVLCLALMSCKNEVDSLIIVKLNPSFISMNEGSNEPMKVAGGNFKKMSSIITTDSVVYAVQVYENDVPYYYGLFNDVSKMQLALTTSKTYKFKVSAYKAGTGKGLKAVIDTAGTNYFLPNKTPLKNKFIKGDALKDIDLVGSIVLNGQAKNYLETDAFFSTKSITVDNGTSNIDFTLLRMGFGINFNVDALTSGNMEIYIGNDTLKLNSSKVSAYTIRQFAITNTFSSILTNADTFGDSITITAKWTSTSGTTMTATGKYKFVRNYQKTINIQLNTLTNNLNFEGWNVVYDTDGNEYHSVKIGTQTWMVENLRTTKYNDGTSIPNVTDSLAWKSLTTPAYCWYKNNKIYKEPYGALYNWHTINTGKLAPQGWHIPTNNEITVLINYLGGVNIAGGKLKAVGTQYWLTPNSGATNSSNFSAVGSGNRKFDSTFDYIGYTCDLWTSTESNTNMAKYWRIYTTSTLVDNFDYSKADGFAVRCIKD